MKTIEDMNRLIGTLPVPLPEGPYMEAAPPPVPQQEAQFPPWLSGAHQFAMQQFLKAFAERQREPQVPSWQMPYPMQATAGERQVLGMMPIAGDVEDVRYLMEGVHEGDPAKAAMGGAAAMMPFMPASLLHTVYHGSPHIFDAFQMSKIGTGEGAQAYGHGLYFAEDPGVAHTYRSQLTRTTQGKVLLDGKPLDKPTPAQALAAGAQEWKGDTMEALNKLKPTGKLYTPEVIEEAKDLVKSGRIGYQKAGALYKVEIPDEAVGRMLDWDAPLSEQPESVRAALDRVLEQRGVWTEGDELVDVYGNRYGLTGRGAYNALSHMNRGDAYTGAGRSQDDAGASEALRQAGIPGIRYFDQGSRTAGEGTRNLVLFDESLATIMERQ